MPFIKECIESVLQQPFCDWELLIGDNCSTDGSREWLKNIVDPRVRIIEQETNKGAFGNLNILFNSARAPIAQILCSDDYLLDNGLHTILDVWNHQDEDVAFIRFNRGRWPYKCPNLQYMQKVLPSVIQSKDSALYFYLFGCLAGNLSNVSVRTKIVTENGGFREDLPYAGDFEFWSRIAQSKPCSISNEQVSFVRAHPGQASNYLNRNGELIPQQNYVYNILIDIIKIKYSDSRLGPLLRKHFISTIDYYQWNAAFRQLFSGNTRRFQYLFSGCRTLTGNWFNRITYLIVSLVFRSTRKAYAKSILRFSGLPY